MLVEYVDADVHSVGCNLLGDIGVQVSSDRTPTDRMRTDARRTLAGVIEGTRFALLEISIMGAITRIVAGSSQCIDVLLYLRLVDTNPPQPTTSVANKTVSDRIVRRFLRSEIGSRLNRTVR